MEDVHAYIYSEVERDMILQRQNLYPETIDHIRMRFERTTQEPSRVFTNVPIRRILDISNLNFTHKIIKYAKYTVETEDGRICTFTDADMINLCAYGLLHLHGYLSRRMENRRELVAYLRRVALVMREQIARSTSRLVCSSG